MKYYKLKISNRKFGVVIPDGEFETFEQAMQAGLGLKRFNIHNEYFLVIQVEETHCNEFIKIPDLVDSK